MVLAYQIFNGMFRFEVIKQTCHGSVVILLEALILANRPCTKVTSLLLEVIKAIIMVLVHMTPAVLSFCLSLLLARPLSLALALSRSIYFRSILSLSRIPSPDLRLSYDDASPRGRMPPVCVCVCVCVCVFVCVCV